MGLVAAPASASAAELLLEDVTTVFDESTQCFYMFPNPDYAPTDWTSPDDYFHGTVELRFEILSQPTSRASNLQLCIEALDADETCSPLTPISGPNVVVTDSSSPADWWYLTQPFDFAHPESWDYLFNSLWDDQGCLLMSGEACWNDHRADYLPMTVRMTAVAVSAGSSFSGWENYVPSSSVPTVHVTSPTEGATIDFGSTVPFTATATAPNGAPFEVTLFDGASPLGVFSAPPIGVDWIASPEGAHTLLARVAAAPYDPVEHQVQVTVVGGAGSGGAGGAGAGVPGGAAGGSPSGGAATSNPAGADDGGCSCRTASRGLEPTSLLSLLPAALLVRSRRQRQAFGRGATARAHSSFGTSR